MKAVITVHGKDSTGIIAKVSRLLSECNINIDDITQTTENGRFLMVMLVNMENMTVTFAKISEMLAELGKSINQKIVIRQEGLFNSMHRI